jgi:hypothetical protein
MLLSLRIPARPGKAGTAFPFAPKPDGKSAGEK